MIFGTHWDAYLQFLPVVTSSHRLLRILSVIQQKGAVWSRQVRQHLAFVYTA